MESKEKSNKPVRQRIENKFKALEVEVTPVSAKAPSKLIPGHNSRMIEWQRYGPEGTTLGFTTEMSRSGKLEYKYFERNRKEDKSRKVWADAKEISKSEYYRDLNT